MRGAESSLGPRDRDIQLAARLVLWTLIALLTAAIVLFGGYPVLADWRYRLAGDLTAALVLLAWLVAAALRPSLLGRTRLLPAVVACLAAYAIATATSVNVRLSAEMLGYALILALLYMLLVRLMASAFWRARFGAIAVVLTLAIGSLYLFVTLSNWIQWWDLTDQTAMPPLRPAYGGLAYGSPNIVAAILLVLGPTACAVLGWSTRARRLIVLGLVLVVVISVAVTGSRGAWLGAAVGAVITICAWGFIPANRRRAIAAMRRVSPRLWALVAVLAVPAAIAMLLAFRSRLTLADHGLRQTYFDVSMTMFQSSPGTGLGPGTWPVQRALFTTDTGVDFWNPHAQSVYMQTLAEFGVVGVIAGAIVIAFLALLVRDALRSSNPLRRRLGYATLFLLTAMAAQQTVDFFANVPALLVAAALPIAWLDATGSDPSLGSVIRRVHLPGRTVALVAAGAVVVVTGGLVRIESIAATGDRGIALAEAGEWSAALAPLAEAAEADPDVTLYWSRLGVAAANAHQHDLAREALERSARGDGYAASWVNLAAEDLALGDAASAQMHVREAERLGWQDAAAMVSAAAIRYWLGHENMALQDAGYAVQAAPSLAADSAGWSTILPGVALERIIERAIAQLDRRRATYGDVAADATQGAIAVFALRADLAADATENLRRHGVPADLAEVPTVAEEAWSGEMEAVAMLEEVARRWPANNAAISWLALLSEREGDTEQSARYRTQALINSPFAVRSAWRLTVSMWTPRAALLAAPTGQRASAYRRAPLLIATTRALPTLQQR